MKTITYIYSVNARGTILKSSGSGMLWNRAKNFQTELIKAFAPDWQVSFISLDTFTNSVPESDVIVFNEMDTPYIPKVIQTKALPISYVEIAKTDIAGIKQRVETFYQAQ